ncbi:MAG TPA: S9 family peptidase [Gemmatimonadales bacterium]
MRIPIARFQRCTRASVLFIAWTFVLATSGTSQTRRLELADLGREIGLSTPRMSPDGKQIVLVQSQINYQDNRFERTLVMVDVASGARRELTPGRRTVADPRWSPSGDRIAFMANEEGKPVQLYLLPMAGGEARQVTDGKRAVEQYAWRPDGTAFAIVTEEEPVEPTGEEKHNKSFEVGDNVYLAQTAPLPRRAWLVPADGSKPTRLPPSSGSVVELRWVSQDQLLIVTKPRPHSGEPERTIAAYDAGAGTERVLARLKGSFGGGLRVSPDGRTLAWAQPRGPEIGFRSRGMYLQPIAGGEARLVSGDLDRDVQSYSWLPDNSGVVLQAPDRTRIGIWITPVGGAPRRLDWGALDPSSELDIGSDGSIAFVGRSPHGPPELYHTPSLEAAPRRLTDLNAELAARELGRVETITWDGPDGFKENGVLIYPPGFTAGRKYPLVLSIHGGPMGTSTEGWSATSQLFAAQGWIVFLPNYRGSNNQGDAFQRAVINDAGDGPGRDVMAGVKAVKALGIVDDQRVAVSGWSYGGYMTAWLTAQYQGWRAAVAGAAVTDWFDWYNLADLNVYAGLGLGGSPWLKDNAANYWRQSPMAYAHKIRTPTLILSTTGDPRVTVTQSYKLYHALKDNGVPVQFIAYPVGGHFPPDPVHQRDVYRRWIAWIEEHFRQGAVAGK